MSYNNRNKVDEKICILEKNKEFLRWFKLIHDGDGYHLDINGLKRLVDNIANWYNVEYPNDYFAEKQLNHKHTSFDSLMSKLDRIEQRTIECPYSPLRVMKTEGTALNWTTDIKPIPSRYDIIYEIENKIIGLRVDKKGVVDLEDNSGYFNGIIDPKTKPIKIEDFYALLPIDGRYDEIERCILKHYWDITLRDQIFKFAILKLLNYPDYGIERAGLALKDLREQFSDIHFEELSEVYADQKAKKPHVKLFRKPKAYL